MKHLRYLLMAALVAMPLTACDEDDDTTITPPVVITGTVSGTVSIEGTGVAGVSVSLVGSSSQTATTGSGGGYSFTGVEGGSYGVAISGIPADATFATTSATTSITTQGQTVTVDFSGAYIRTSSIAGQVMVDGTGIAGVSVTATGTPEGSKSAVTDNAGSYNFSGLRAGDYTIALSNIPAAYSFDPATQTVTVGTGEAKIVGFYGTELVTTDLVTATILIKSVTFPNGNAQNPAAIAGLMVVTLQIDPGENNLSSVTLFLDGDSIAGQTLSNAAPGQDDVRMLQGAIFEVDFAINTAAFDGATGVVTYVNGTKALSASLGLNNAEEASVSTSLDLTFANADTFVGTVTPSKTPVISTTGILYWGGSVTMDVTTVNYSGKTTASVTGNFSNNLAGSAITDGAAPFSFTWSSAAGKPLVGYQTLLANTAAETFGVIRAQYSDNTLYTGGVLNLATGLTLDNVAPPAAVYWLTEQLTPTTTDCCANNWVGPDYSFSAGMAATPDNGNGVGGVTTTYHMGVASSTAAAAALPAITKGSDAGVAPAVLNTDYRTVAVTKDALGNSSTNVLAASATAVNPLATTVGYDNVAPPAVTVGGITAAQTIYNNIAGSNTAVPMTFAYTADDRSGFSADPLQGTFYYKAPTGTITRLVSGSATSTTAVSIPAGLWPVCTGNPTGFRNVAGAAGSECVPDVATGTGPDGYYTLSFVTQDRAGNQSAAFTRSIFVDATAPSTGNAVGPTILTGGASTAFTASVTDNAEVGTTWFGLGYGAVPFAYIPFAATSSQADGDWEATFTKSATATTTFNFVRQINTAVGVLLGTGNAASIRTLHTDAAGNPSAAASINTFAAGAVTGNAAVGAGAETYVLTAPAKTLCDGTGAACNTAGGNVRSATLTYTATGPTGTYTNPFTGGGKLYIYAVSDVNATIFNDASSYYLVGTLDGDAAVMSDDNVNRYYTWTYSLTSADITGIPTTAVPAGVPLGAMQLAVLASTKNGDALHSVYLATITRATGS